METEQNRTVTIKFYSYMVFQGHPQEEEMSYMFRSIDVVTKTVELVARLFNGEVKYDGDGSETVQYDDVVYFKNLSEVDEQWILKQFTFARTRDIKVHQLIKSLI